MVDRRRTLDPLLLETIKSFVSDGVREAAATVMDTVERSHQATAKVQSNGYGEVLQRLARFEAKLDDSLRRIDDHETRIRELQSGSDIVNGSAKVAGRISGAVWGIVSALVTGIAMVFIDRRI